MEFSWESREEDLQFLSYQSHVCHSVRCNVIDGACGFHEQGQQKAAKKSHITVEEKNASYLALS